MKKAERILNVVVIVITLISFPYALSKLAKSNSDFKTGLKQHLLRGK